MSAVSHPFMGKVFVGKPATIGTSRDKYDNVLMEGEMVEREYKGVRDAMIFTDRRIVVINKQGILGSKVELTSFPWRSISAFAVESAGTADLDAELKICGSGWGVCEVEFLRGVDVADVCRFINGKIF